MLIPWYVLGTIYDLHLPSRNNVDLPYEAERELEILFANGWSDRGD